LSNLIADKEVGEGVLIPNDFFLLKFCALSLTKIFQINWQKELFFKGYDLVEKNDLERTQLQKNTAPVNFRYSEKINACFIRQGVCLLGT